MGYPCPASPEDRVEKAAEAKSPAPTPQFPPRGPKDQRLEDPIPLPDPILQQPARGLSPYDVINVQHLARRLLIDRLGIFDHIVNAWAKARADDSD